MGSLDELKKMLIDLENFVEYCCGSTHCDTNDEDKKLLERVQDVTENFDAYKKEWVDKEISGRLKEFENSQKTIKNNE